VITGLDDGRCEPWLYDLNNDDNNNEIVRNVLIVIGHCSVTVRDIDGVPLYF
jgi:hypothetical protein